VRCAPGTCYLRRQDRVGEGVLSRCQQLHGRANHRQGERERQAPEADSREEESLPRTISVVGAVEKRGKGFAADIAVANAQSSGAASLARSLGSGSANSLKIEVAPRGSGDVKASGTALANVLGNPKKQPKACDPSTPANGAKLAGTPPTSAPSWLEMAENGCQDKPLFDVTIENGSWTHHKPDQGHTTVCADVTTKPPLPFDDVDADLDALHAHAKLGRDGSGRVSWVIASPGDYQATAVIAFFFTEGHSNNLTIPVAPPDQNGPTPC
jgi:hypothetical protein